jgi:accessory gene regulator protein AgrB
MHVVWLLDCLAESKTMTMVFRCMRIDVWGIWLHVYRCLGCLVTCVLMFVSPLLMGESNKSALGQKL